MTTLSTSTVRATALPLAATTLAPPTLKEGARGSQVVDLQRKLAAAGFSPGSADGVFGPKTTTAVKSFQRAKGLTADGIVGPQTWNALNAPPPSSQPVLKQGARGSAVVDLQKKLAAHGFSPGAADGVFGPGTEAAVKSFQSAKGLTADGVVGAKTWAALAAAPTKPTDPGPVSGGVSLQQLKQIMPHLSDARARECLPHLNKAMAEAGINTPKRQAAFLAQLAHESGEFRYFEEIASGAAYEGRKDLGNIYPGDGVRYKGRGPIQLTGRNNYRAAGKALGIDLENNPKRAADVDVGFRTAAWFWNSRNLNTYADAGNFREITRRINGGYNGLSSREAYYARAKQVLGA
ncbi:peptidoglycan-binding protein [Hyalangium versicolor]|uniref:peptidoglycan-binding protein n=1 Tax=Hyalangium versicolor TaxID=2861190 RepID=UPI001CCF11AB|nr:peptidoglycan-binding protein [Hyalangium versicolor]